MSGARRDCGRTEWLIGVAEKAQMIKISSVEKLTGNVQHFEYDGFALSSGRKYDLGCDATCFH